ncbi:MAG: CBS domain-containing protein, partial [Armatimonadota bacterium]|nr:CBS domain-containing protein [Armatimonadota bacterium]
MGHDILSEVREALADADLERLRPRLEALWPADLAEVIERLNSEERQQVLSLLSDEAAGTLLHVLDEAVAADVIAALPPERASRILGESPRDDAADVLQDLPEAAADALLAGMDAEDARAVRELLEYPENTAGGRMNTEFPRVSETARVSEVMADLRANPPAAETSYYLYVCDDGGRLRGVVSLRELVVAAPDARIGDIMTREVVSIRADAGQDEAAELVARYDLLALPVVDDTGRMVGVITVDDVMEVLEDEATQDILGIPTDEETPSERTSLSLAARARGLVPPALGGLAAAALFSAYAPS